jgi:hypothetical protein
MILRKYRWPLFVVLAGCAAIAFIAALWLFLPRIDESVGFFTGRALRVIQDHQDRGHTVRDIVLSKYKNVHWRAYHRDDVCETYVRCDALDRNGAPVVLVWVVMTLPERRGVLFHVRTIATAHTESAFNVAPSLYEPGHTLYGSPDYANW